MYARGDVDGALAVWQEALALAPGDSRAMGYVDYVVSNYQVLRKPTIAEASSDGMEIADETSSAGLAIDGMVASYQRTTVDDGWFLDDDMGASYAAVVDPRGAASPSEPPPPLPEENEFLAPSATVDAPNVAKQLAQHAPAGERGAFAGGQGNITVPPPTQGRPAVFAEAGDEDAALLEARLRGARHTLAPGSVPPAAEIMRSLRPRLQADEVESPDRFSRPTAPPMSATLEATAAALLAPSDDASIGDTTAEVQYAPELVQDFPTGPMAMPLPQAAVPEPARTARFEAVVGPTPDFGEPAEMDFGDFDRIHHQRMDLDAPVEPPPPSPSPDRAIPRPGTHDVDLGDYEMELELAPGMALQPAFVEPVYGKAAAAKRAFPEPALGDDDDFFGRPIAADGPAPLPPSEPEVLTPVQALHAALARATAHLTNETERVRERVTWLLARSKTEYAAGNAELAIFAADAAFRESPDSATAQKLIYGEATRLEAMFSDYLGSTQRVPSVALSMEVVMAKAIDPRAAFLLSRIDGMSTFEEIIDISGMAQLEALRHLAWFVADGVIVSQ